MVDAPVLRDPCADEPARIGDVVLTDVSHLPKWKTWHDQHKVPIGRSYRVGDDLIFAVSPGEWLVVGSEPASDHVDLTHVRAMLRIGGPDARHLLSHVCGLDLSDLMTPDGSVARTLVSGVVTELVREDRDGHPAYLLLMSRSFARSVWDHLIDLAEDA